MGSDARFPVLGRTQRTVMQGLFDHGSWAPGCGWCAVSPADTHRALMGLERKGLAQHTGDKYWLTPAGWSWLMVATAMDLRLLAYDGQAFRMTVRRLQHLTYAAAITAQAGAPVDWRGDRA